MTRVPINEPINEEDHLKLREQQRDFERDQFMLSNKIYAEQNHDYRMRSFEYVKEYGVLTIRTLFLLNGAAILGLLTFVASFFTKNDQTIILVGISMAHRLVFSFNCFVVGLICAALVSGVGYLNYNSFHAMYDSPVNLYRFVNAKDNPIIDDKHRKHVVLLANIAALFSVLGLACFAVGALNVANAFSVLGI